MGQTCTERVFYSNQRETIGLSVYMVIAWGAFIVEILLLLSIIRVHVSAGNVLLWMFTSKLEQEVFSGVILEPSQLNLHPFCLSGWLILQPKIKQQLRGKLCGYSRMNLPALLWSRAVSFIAKVLKYLPLKLLGCQNYFTLTSNTNIKNSIPLLKPRQKEEKHKRHTK